MRNIKQVGQNSVDGTKTSLMHSCCEDAHVRSNSQNSPPIKGPAAHKKNSQRESRGTNVELESRVYSHTAIKSAKDGVTGTL